MCSLLLFRPPHANVDSYQLNRLLSASEVAVGTSFRFCEESLQDTVTQLF